MKSLHKFKLILDDKFIIVGYNSRATFSFNLSSSKLPVFDLFSDLIKLQKCDEIVIPTSQGMMTIKYLGVTRDKKLIKIIKIRTKLAEFMGYRL